MFRIIGADKTIKVAMDGFCLTAKASKANYNIHVGSDVSMQKGVENWQE